MSATPAHRDLDHDRVFTVLNSILEAELSGVVRYTHYSLMIIGPNRIPLVAFMKAQATESLLHAQQVGEILTGLGGHPSLRIT
ncbi:MAG TPA: ferritin-like domain-containing protein, partial [Ilumatobacteraceae bacterium]|nr:ferritin-like domain-containing protein [Ilumatobacteraceae bacterium]